MKKNLSNSTAKILLAFILLLSVSNRALAQTGTDLQFSGWIPYWAKTAGVEDVVSNTDNLDSVSPFSYEVDSKGNLLDKGKKDAEPWTTLFRNAKRDKVEIIPSILWTNAASMHTVLSDPELRKEHEKQIYNEILKNKKFAGVDIDYEGKWAETRGSFSTFLREISELADGKGKKLVCTIEARTPVEDKFEVVDKARLSSIQYSNDYAVVAEVCDQVKLMTYDQGAIDIKLNATKKGKDFYAPVADPAWVEKVIKLTLKDIPAEKIHLGLASYGYVYELTPRKAGGYDYKRLRAINYPLADSRAKEKGITPTRNSAGELSYTYTDPAYPGKIILVWYSDSQAMQQKIDLAKKYNLAGVAVFKFDGEHDEKFWEVINKNN